MSFASNATGKVQQNSVTTGEGGLGRGTSRYKALEMGKKADVPGDLVKGEWVIAGRKGGAVRSDGVWPAWIGH